MEQLFTNLNRAVEGSPAIALAASVLWGVLSIVLAATNVHYGALLLLTYGVGHCAVIVAAGSSTELVQRFLNWNEQSKGLAAVKIVCGILVMLGGVWLICTVP